jgi:hypothetical protein
LQKQNKQYKVTGIFRWSYSKQDSIVNFYREKNQHKAYGSGKMIDIHCEKLDKEVKTILVA